MDKLTTTKRLLSNLGLPLAQRSDLCVLTILAMANIREQDPFSYATNEWIRIHDVISFIGANYGTMYAENTRETIRKQAMHHFRTAAMIEDNGVATNSPKYMYRLTEEFLKVVREIDKHGVSTIENHALADFLHRHEQLVNIYASKKVVHMLPIRINKDIYTLSPGTHNSLQKAILEEFAPRFAPNCECLYIGDTSKKDLFKDDKKLKTLGISVDIHDKLPDVILYSEEKDWIYFIEAVDSTGPMSPERVRDINLMTRGVKAGKVFVTAFLSFSKYKKFSDQIAWETEVWIADNPDHLIHLNGDRFIGPR